MREIILASGSPRRRELLEKIGVPFRVVKSGAEEVTEETDPGEAVKCLSMQKALDVAARVEKGIVLGADTVVGIEGRILGKPRDRQEARDMLTSLQGRVHSVFTGVALVEKRGRAEPAFPGEQSRIRVLHSFFRETKVQIHQMSSREIEKYLDTGDAFDKAGSYGIQGPFAAFVDGIQGDYTNVVGLPVSAVYQALAGLEEEPSSGCC